MSDKNPAKHCDRKIKQINKMKFFSATRLHESNAILDLSSAAVDDPPSSRTRIRHLQVSILAARPAAFKVHRHREKQSEIITYLAYSKFIQSAVQLTRSCKSQIQKEIQPSDDNTAH